MNSPNDPRIFRLQIIYSIIWACFGTTGLLVVVSVHFHIDLLLVMIALMCILFVLGFYTSLTLPMLEFTTTAQRVSSIGGALLFGGIALSTIYSEPMIGISSAAFGVILMIASTIHPRSVSGIRSMD